MQIRPFPSKPSLHLHVKFPSLLIHCADVSQLCKFRAHSSISETIDLCLIKRSRTEYNSLLFCVGYLVKIKVELNKLLQVKATYHCKLCHCPHTLCYKCTWKFPLCCGILSWHYNHRLTKHIHQYLKKIAIYRYNPLDSISGKLARLNKNVRTMLFLSLLTFTC